MSAGTLFLGIQGIQGTGKEIRHLGNTPSKEKTRNEPRKARKKVKQTGSLPSKKGATEEVSGCSIERKQSNC